MNIFHYIKLFKLLADSSSENLVGHVLLDNGWTISVAESCTGGLLSSLLTDVSGSSLYIHENFVTYANSAKIKFLNVKEETLQKYGAVSSQTAYEMVQGLLCNTSSDFAIATTGIAGPGGGSAEKPVGLVYIGIGSSDGIETYKYNVSSSYPRILIKYLFAKHAVKLLCNFLKNKQRKIK